MKFIGKVSSPVALEMIEEIFKDNGIDLIPQDRGSEEVLPFIMGTPDEEIDLFVDEAHAEAAIALYEVYMKETAEVLEHIDESELELQEEDEDI